MGLEDDAIRGRGQPRDGPSMEIRQARGTIALPAEWIPGSPEKWARFLLRHGRYLDGVFARHQGETQVCADRISAGRHAVEVERKPTPAGWCTLNRLRQWQRPIASRPLGEQ